MVYEPRLTHAYAEVYRATGINSGPVVLNTSTAAAADIGLLANAAPPSSGEYPENRFEAEAVATGWIAAAQGGKW